VVSGEGVRGGGEGEREERGRWGGDGDTYSLTSCMPYTMPTIYLFSNFLHAIYHAHYIPIL
jgi:hypothetical protein